MPLDTFTKLARSSLAVDLPTGTGGPLTLLGGDGAKFPTKNASLILGTGEIVNVSSRAADTFTIRSRPDDPGILTPAGTSVICALLPKHIAALMANIPTPRVGDYLWPMCVNAATAATVAGTIWTPSLLAFCPIVIPCALTVDKINVFVVTAGSAGALERMGIYADNGTDGQPGALIVDGGTVAVTATGFKEVTLGAPVTLQPGIVWVGGSSQGGPTTGAALQYTMSNMPGMHCTSGAYPAAYTQAGVAGALPDPAVAAPTFLAFSPMFSLHVASII